MPKDNPPRFKVDPSVVYQLGESMISDALMALIELVKNSYDADATYAKVIISTSNNSVIDDTIFPSSNGRIIVEDDGTGMNLEEIETGWLTISNRKKHNFKKAKKTTPGGRSPLGDKGLGRLGVQKLGEHLEILTKSPDDHGYHFGFSWLDFATAPNLESVNIHLSLIDFPRNQGTKVIVSELKETDFWRGQHSLKRLEQELARMISPYSRIRNFTVIVEVDGKKLELLEITENIRKIAPVKYEISFDGERFSVIGFAKLDFFRPRPPEDANLFALHVEADNGQKFLDFIKSNKLANTFNVQRSMSKQWFVEFSYNRELASLDRVQRSTVNHGDIANPGPFFGEIDSFDLGADSFRNQNVFDRINEYRRHIKELSGIRVYRDGFAIRVEHDWLKLGAQWTSATSFYGLKPDNTLGYIALSASDNMNLEETTDREGFKDSPYFRNFYALLQEFTSFTTRAHNYLGRSWTNFHRKRNETIAQVDSRKTVEAMSNAIKKGLAEAPQHQANLNKFKERLSASVTASKSVTARLRDNKIISPELREKVKDALADMEPLLIGAQVEIGRLSSYLEELSSLKNMGQVLEDRVDGLRRQMDDMYEAVALGLTAEALSHEVYNVADQLAKRAKAVQKSMKSKGNTDHSVLVFIEYVQSSVMALRKQMSFMSSSFRYVRDQKHTISILHHINELVTFYTERLRNNDIDIEVLYKETELFNLQINKGKLTQVVDNLILNSEYWLKEDIAQKRLSKAKIIIELSRPFIRIYDTGSGIDPSVENALFEPFVSAKAKGLGRGLGLFISKQLLDSEGCNIGLLPERNSNQRLFKFQIDVRGVLHE